MYLYRKTSNGKLGDVSYFNIIGRVHFRNSLVLKLNLEYFVYSVLLGRFGEDWEFLIYSIIYNKIRCFTTPLNNTSLFIGYAKSIITFSVKTYQLCIFVLFY